MAGNASYNELLTTTIENRREDVADSATDNNALLTRLKKKGNMDEADGGTKLTEEILYAGNTNGQWYSGSEVIAVGSTQDMTLAEYAWKQYAISIVLTGLELGQNQGRARMIPLMAKKLKGAVSKMSNDVSVGLYGDGTSFSSKTLTGLLAMCPVDPTTGTYGGINRATAGNEWWRPYALDTNAAPAASTIQAKFTLAYSNLVQGAEHTDLIVCDGDVWTAYAGSLQALQRFTSSDEADGGFPSLKFMGADVVLDGGINGQCTDVTAYFLNTNHVHWRPMKGRNMVPLDPESRTPYNQDIVAKLLGFYGNLTCSAARLQGQIVFS